MNTLKNTSCIAKSKMMEENMEKEDSYYRKLNHSWRNMLTELDYKILDFLKGNLRPSRLSHVERVVGKAIELAEYYGQSKAKAITASLCHDMYRNISKEKANLMIRELELDEDLYIDNLNLAHSKLAAVAARCKFSITDEDVINAISYHTTGRAAMSRLEQIIFIADAIEDGRSYPGVEELRKLAFINLDETCLKLLVHTREYLKENNIENGKDANEAIEYYSNLLNNKDRMEK